MIDIHFIRPNAWWLLLALVPIVWQLLRYQSQDTKWQGIIDPNLLPHLLQKSHATRTGRYLFLFVVGWIIAVFSLAGPSWRQLPQAVFQSTDPLVVVLDLSTSMTAQDVAPSRLQAAKFKILDLLKRRHDGQTALIVYAGEPYVVSPLTQDAETLTHLINTVSPDMMPAPGRDTQRAVAKANALLKQVNANHGAVLLLTADAVRSSALTAAKRLQQQYRLYVLGVGSRAGAPIQDANGEFAKDTQGNVVLSKLGKDSLQQLAVAGGGKYFTLQVGDQDLQQIEPFLHSAQSVKKSSQRLRWEDEGHWFILLLLPLVLISFRRGFW